jgi:hypothetical protein
MSDDWAISETDWLVDVRDTPSPARASVLVLSEHVVGKGARV